MIVQEIDKMSQNLSLGKLWKNLSIQYQDEIIIYLEQLFQVRMGISLNLL